jgi:Leucine-rich repeat (LRR) protein
MTVWVSPETANLAILDLHSVDVKDAGMPQLAAIKSLRELNLSDSRFTDKDWRCWGAAKLERLTLTRTRINEKGLESLAGFPALQGLTLDYLPVSDKVLESLKRLPALKQLSLDYANITDRGAEILQSFAPLQLLDIYHTPVSKKAYDALHAALPQCQIFYDDQSSNPQSQSG